MQRPTRDHEIEALFAPRVVRSFASLVSPSLIAELRDEETPALAPMVASRQAEFATARACARAAMAEFEVDAAVPRRDGGAPLWPEGMAGSISHTRGFCVAVASLEATAVGIDVEEVARMKPSVERRVLVSAEQDALAGLDDDLRRERVASIFAAKEAFYKAHYEVDARYLGFDAVTVTIDGSTVQFSPASGAVDAELLARTSGRVRLDQGRVIVGVVIGGSTGKGPLPSPA